MSLANLLSERGPSAGRSADDRARASSSRLESGFTITRIELNTAGASRESTRRRSPRLAEQAKATCPVSRALAGTEITLDAQLWGDAAPAIQRAAARKPLRSHADRRCSLPYGR